MGGGGGELDRPITFITYCHLRGVFSASVVRDSEGSHSGKQYNEPHQAKKQKSRQPKKKRTSPCLPEVPS